MDIEKLRPHILIKDEPAAPVKREYDGGGGGTYPRNSYQQHAAKILAEADRLSAIFGGVRDRDISKRYFKVEIPEDQKVSTSTGKVLENNLHSSIVGSPASNIAHVCTTKESFDDLVAQLGEYNSTPLNRGKSKYASIENLSEIPFSEKASERFYSEFDGENDEGDALITLFPDIDSEDMEIITKGVKVFLNQHQGKVLSFLPREEGALLKVRSKQSVLKNLAEMFVSIQSLDSADEVVTEMANIGESVENTITVRPNSSKAYACMFDTGINNGSRFLNESIIEDSCPFGENKGVGVTHGTFVASRIIYGDSIKDQISSGVLSPDVKLLSVCINSFDSLGNKQKVTVDRLIAVIRETVEKWHKEIRVYNLSISCTPQNINAPASIKDDIVHQLASELDTLSRKYDVLFVTCTGNLPWSNNIPNPSMPYPDYFSDNNSRIMSPGESMLGLTVGSIALEEAAGSMAKKSEPSPFTRRGPGFSGHFKPDLVAHGGNCGRNWSQHDFLNVIGFSDLGNFLSYARGTSYSTPLITRLAAKLFELFPSSSACLTKAMLIHFAQEIPSENFNSDSLIQLQGHGQPVVPMLTNSTKNIQSYLYQGYMDYRDMIEIPFYVPSVLINRKVKDKVKIKVTISFYPETSAVLKSGYCKSHIRTKIIKLNKSAVEKDVPFSNSTALESERYSTVIKMAKVFSREISAGNWKILIAHESRWTLRNPKTQYAVVITVEDPQNDQSIDIHNAIRQEVPNSYLTELGIQERIQI
jgi:hypothetical protein